MANTMYCSFCGQLFDEERLKTEQLLAAPGGAVAICVPCINHATGRMVIVAEAIARDRAMVESKACVARGERG